MWDAPSTSSGKKNTAVSHRPATRRQSEFARPPIPRNVIVLGVVSFFADVSSEIVYPLVPIFLTTVLGAPVAIVGLIEGVAESTASVVKFFSGWWSDRLPKRLPLVLGGYGLAALGKLLLGLAGAWPLVLTARFIDRLGKGVRGSPRDALIADSTAPDQRGRAYGLHRSMDTAGAVVGPLLALALVAWLDEALRTVFLLAVIPGVLSTLAVLFVREPARAQPKPRVVESSSGAAKPATGLGSLDRRLVLFLMASLIFAIGNSSDIFLLLRAKQLGLSTTAAILGYVVFNFVYMSAAYPIGALSDRIGRRGIFVAGLALFTATYVGFAVISTPTLVWPLFAVYGLYMACTDGVGKALVSDFAPAEKRGAMLGLYGTITGVATFAASVLAGLLWDYVGVPAPFMLGAAAAVIAGALLLLAGGTSPAQPVRS